MKGDDYMFNKQLRKNIQELDVRISKLYEELDKASTEGERKIIIDEAKELANLRSRLSTVKARESIAPVVIPGVMGLAAMFMVIRHEETNVITTKALGIAMKFIRGH